MNPSIIERKERWARKMSGKERPTVRSHDRLPPGQHLTRGFPVLDLGIQPEIPTSEWKLQISGLVENPVTLGWDEFQQLPQFEDVSDFHCVTTWSKYDCRWGGVSFFTLTELVKPKPEATHLYYSGHDGYSTNTTLEAALDDDALVATRFDGQPIAREHGGPARIIIPKLYAWKGAKFVRSIEFLDKDKLGFWEVRGYSNTADPWTEDRFLENRMLLEVRNLTIRFAKRDGSGTPAVEDVSLSLERGRGLAIVGESGSGKSVTALALTRLLPEPPASYESGAILLEDRDVRKMSVDELRVIRGGKIAYIFQEPATSLNPVFNLRTQIGEVLRLHRPDIAPAQRDAEAVRWLERVGIANPAQRLSAYPHELSGGMQQRAMIAMALCGRPSLLVADEPTTALDVTVQAEIMTLLRELKEQLQMAVILITHNFGIIRGLADDVAVMFRGRIVEQGPTEKILRQPQHPYTKALIDCIPRLGDKRPRLATIDHDALAKAL